MPTRAWFGNFDFEVPDRADILNAQSSDVHASSFVEAVV
jgi:hypothetical protein